MAQDLDQRIVEYVVANRDNPGQIRRAMQENGITAADVNRALEPIRQKAMSTGYDEANQWRGGDIGQGAGVDPIELLNQLYVSGITVDPQDPVAVGDWIKARNSQSAGQTQQLLAELWGGADKVPQDQQYHQAVNAEWDAAGERDRAGSRSFNRNLKIGAGLIAGGAMGGFNALGGALDAGLGTVGLGANTLTNAAGATYGAGGGALTPADIAAGNAVTAGAGAIPYGAGGGELTAADIVAGNAAQAGGVGVEAATTGADALTLDQGATMGADAGVGNVATASAAEIAAAAAAAGIQLTAAQIAAAAAAVKAGKDIIDAVTQVTGSKAAGEAAAKALQEAKPYGGGPESWVRAAGYDPSMNSLTTMKDFGAAAGYKMGGTGDMPKDLYNTYSNFLQNPADMAKNPMFSAFNKQQQQATERAAQARGMNYSGNMVAALGENAMSNWASYYPKLAETYRGGAATEADVWNTENAGNIARGNLATNAYSAANLANANAGRVGFTGYDLAATDAYRRGIAGAQIGGNQATDQTTGYGKLTKASLDFLTNLGKLS